MILLRAAGRIYRSAALACRDAILKKQTIGVPDVFRGESGLLLARETVDNLGARQIPTYPANYEIWATYRAGTHPDLNREIDQHIAAGGEFTDAQNEEIFEKYFANVRLSVQIIEAGEAAARELANASANMRDAGAGAEAYADDLSAAAHRIQSSASRAEFQEILLDLATRTSTMALRSAQLARDLADSSRHVDALQHELRSVKVQALTDSLTGLANRRMFDETLRRRLTEAHNDHTDLCLALCDIDHFKRTNDKWGHSVGDQVIQFIAKELRRNAREDWLVARYGGEEFAIVMPRTSLAQAREIAVKLNAMIGSKRLARRSTGDNIGAITVSIGVAAHNAAETAQALFERADANLYEAKRSGRNKVCCDDDAVVSPDSTSASAR